MAERDPRIAASRRYPAYEQDYAAWLSAQLGLLAEGRFDRLDLTNLIDEVNDLGLSEYKSFVSAIEIVVAHMLKWDHQPQKRSNGWIASIDEHRSRIERALDRSPSYKARREDALSEAYRPARAIAARQTKLPLKAFPASLPYDWNEVMRRDHNLAS